MTKPSLIAFVDARSNDGPKVYLRTLLYSTGRRGHVVESMFLRIRRGESHLTFNIWAYQDQTLVRGSGLFIGHEGLTFDHHFLPPRDGAQFRFLPGDYELEVCASLVHRRSPILLSKTHLHLTEQQAEALRDEHADVYFNWGPDSNKYHAHIERKKPELDVHDPDIQALLKMADA